MGSTSPQLSDALAAWQHFVQRLRQASLCVAATQKMTRSRECSLR